MILSLHSFSFETIFKINRYMTPKIFSLLLLFTLAANAQQVLPENERAQLIDEILADRFNKLLPRLMDEADIDMWVLVSREYNEDPVLRTMLPATWLNARRRTILLFYRDKAANSIEKLAVARYNVGKNIFSAWDKEKRTRPMETINGIDH